jgi:hypothetical protein
MKNLFKLALIFAIFWQFSCKPTKLPDVINPIPNYVSYIIDKTATKTDYEQVFWYNDEIEIVIPPMTMNGNCKIKVQKKISTPDANIKDVKAGTGYYIIKFIGETNFNSKIKCIIKYDPSMIDPKSNAVKSVKGIINTKGKWEIADFEIDETNHKIIFKISSISGKNLKDKPELMSDGEIIIGSGYTIIDDGQNDELLAKLKYFACKFEFGDFDIIKISDNNPDKTYKFEYTGLFSNSGFETGPGQVDSAFVVFNANKFTINRYFKSNDASVLLSISGEVDKTTWIVSNLNYKYIYSYKLSSDETRTDEIYVQFNQIYGEFKDYWGQIYDLVLNSKSLDKQYEDLNRIIKDISFTITFKKDNQIVDIYKLKKINENKTKNYFSLSLRSQP